MKQEFELELQAYLDGELSPGEASAVAARIQSDPAARALHDQLKQTIACLRGNEMERRLPEAQEFYWSKIEREIMAQEPVEAAAAEAPWWLTAIRRHMAAISGVGVAAALLVIGAFQLNWVSRDLFEEIDNPLDETTSFSFRSESQKMTVVWIANAPATPAENEPDPGVETLQ